MNSKLIMYKSSPVFYFVLLFLIFYFGTQIVIGLAAPGGLYISFFEKYLDYVSWLRISLLYGSKYFLSILGFASHLEPNYTLRLDGGRHIVIAFDCAGYGVLSFWFAFVLSVRGKSYLNRFIWLTGGAVLLWTINCFRISFYLLSRNGITKIPFKMDHHTFYNILSYGLIGLLIILHEKKSGTSNKLTQNQ